MTEHDQAKKNPYSVIAGSEFRERPAARRDLVDRILDDPRMHDHRDGFLSCLQCGVCTSGCPAARFTDYSPREVARRAYEGDPTLLEDDTIWYCFYCYTCQSRCPRKNSVAVINQVVRSMQVESGYGIKHVEMFAAWGEQFYDKGMGGTPHVFFSDIAEAWGPKWKEFIAGRDELRERLGVGGMYRTETQATRRLLDYAAAREAPVVTICLLCRDNLRSAARRRGPSVPIYFWPEFFDAAEPAGAPGGDHD